MKRFWVFYSVLPLLLITAFFGVGFASEIAAAPGIVLEKTVQFYVSPDATDPNITFQRVNDVRKFMGLVPLVTDEKLGELAKDRANDMASRKYYAHLDPDGKYFYDYLALNNVTTGYSCENLDLTFEPNQNQIVSDWLSSTKGHRDCMMNPKVTHAGYASTKLSLVDFNGSEATAYIVVAIHAEITD